MVITAVLVILMGLFMLFRPAVVWSITEGWKSNDATEPSDLYLFSTRFGGGACILAGIGGIIALMIL